jgi:hypothetical protein
MIALRIIAAILVVIGFMQLCRRAGHVLADADEMYNRWWLVLLAVALVAPTADAGGIRTFHSFHGTGRSPQQAIDAPQADPPRRTHSLLPRRSSTDSKAPEESDPRFVTPKAKCDCGCKDCTGKPGCPCKCDDCKCNEKSAPPKQTKRRGLLKRLFSGRDVAWIDFNPPGSKSECGIYDDVRSRAPNTPWYPDAATRCHEWTHLVNGRISVRFSRPAFYVGGGRAVVFAKPRLMLPDVAKYVTQFRNDYRSRFVVGYIAASHRDDPFDILDEFSAYANDLQCQREKHMAWQGTEDQLRHYSHYADALIAAVKERDPDYPDLDKLTAFVEYQQDRAQKLIDSQPHANHHASAGPPHRIELVPIVLRDFQEDYDGEFAVWWKWLWHA